MQYQPLRRGTHDRRGTERHNVQGLGEFEVTRVTHLEGFEGRHGQDTMAEWLRRQIRISFAICFPMGAQVQILLVSTFFLLFLNIAFAPQKLLKRPGAFHYYLSL